MLANSVGAIRVGRVWISLDLPQFFVMMFLTQPPVFCLPA
jgi:hypothetical protein